MAMTAESGPFCRHYSDPGDCEAVCSSCGHTCRNHYGATLSCDKCSCQGFGGDFDMLNNYSAAISLLIKSIQHAGFYLQFPCDACQNQAHPDEEPDSACAWCGGVGARLIRKPSP